MKHIMALIFTCMHFINAATLEAPVSTYKAAQPGCFHFEVPCADEGAFEETLESIQLAPALYKTLKDQKAYAIEGLRGTYVANKLKEYALKIRSPGTSIPLHGKYIEHLDKTITNYILINYVGFDAKARHEASYAEHEKIRAYRAYKRDVNEEARTLKHAVLKQIEEGRFQTALLSIVCEVLDITPSVACVLSLSDRKKQTVVEEWAKAGWLEIEEGFSSPAAITRMLKHSPAPNHLILGCGKQLPYKTLEAAGITCMPHYCGQCADLPHREECVTISYSPWDLPDIVADFTDPAFWEAFDDGSIVKVTNHADNSSKKIALPKKSLLIAKRKLANAEDILRFAVTTN